jgi:hypothetical protein
MAGTFTATTTTTPWNYWAGQTYSTASTTTTLTWDRWNGTSCTTGDVYKLAVHDPFPFTAVSNNDTCKAYRRTITIDGFGNVIDHPLDLTQEQREEAERAWLRFQPEYVKRKYQAEQARHANQWQLQADIQQRRFETERQMMQAQMAAQNAKLLLEQEARRTAEERAEKLLTENLSGRQLAGYRQTGTIVVHGRHARYRIRGGRSMNIDVVDKRGKVSHRLCAYPGEPIPQADTMLAQKLWLEGNEDEFLRVAITHQALQANEQVLPALQ